MDDVMQMRIFSKAKYTPNTFIGGIAKQGGTGVSAPIDTRELLASTIGIEPYRIKGFKVVGDDVECRIRGNYNIPQYAFTTVGTSNSNLNITSYNDEEGLVENLNGFAFYGTTINSCNFPNATNTGSRIFDNCAQFREGLFPNVVTLTGLRCFALCTRASSFNLTSLVEITGERTFQQVGTHASSTLTELDLRKLKLLPSGNNLTFYLIKIGITIKVHIDLLTINSGLPDASLTYAKNTRSCTVEFYDDNGDYVSTL